MTTPLDQVRAGRLFRPLDVQVAWLLARLDQGQCPELPLLAALASWATGQGHTCLPLSVVPALLTEAGLDNSGFRDPAALGERLLASPLVGRAGEVRPLVLDPAGNLFLFRLHRDEEVIAQALRHRTAGSEPAEVGRVAALLDQLFPGSLGSTTIDWQRLAAALALCQPFVVISGGPGTGKTFTAARILALLAALASKKPRIALAAPTGKAALRLQESIRAAKTTLPPELATEVPEEAQTLHRLLGYRVDRPGFRHHGANPLHLDLLILDEASMIDVELMAATLAALPAACRIILLGDRDQLASVEAGNLFGDLCGDGVLRWSAPLINRLRPLIVPTHLPAPPTAPISDTPTLADALIILHTSHRFRETSGIGTLARAVNSGDPEVLDAALHQETPDLHLEEVTGPAMTAWLRERIEDIFRPLFAAASPEAALQELGRSRILCALREGPAGVEGINRLAENMFRRNHTILPQERLYRGMPILILRNDYHLGLFNGDTGVLWPDDQGILQAWLPLADGGLRPVGLARLPAWQTSYALTVHKAQGSEFDRVLLILPQEDAPILSRELLYTGITRARAQLTLCCCRELLHGIVQRRVVRYSGLAAKLGRDEGERPLQESTAPQGIA